MNGDESVDAFFTRRFGKPLAENMISAMIHGIYSGDTRLLSMRAIFPGVWEAEREWGSVILSGLFGNLWRKWGWLAPSPYQRQLLVDAASMSTIKARLAAQEGGTELINRMEGASVWGLRGGLEVLTDRLREYLLEQGVEFQLGESAGKIDALDLVQGGWQVRRFRGDGDGAKADDDTFIRSKPGLPPYSLPT